MKDFIESAFKVFSDKTGFPIDPEWTPYAVLAIVAGSVFLWIFQKIRLRLGDMTAVSEELKVTSEHISGQTKIKLDEVANRLSTLNEDLRQSIHARLNEIETVFRSTSSIDDLPADPNIEGGQAEAALEKLTRRKQAEAVRNATIEKWLTGTLFVRSDNDPNNFEFGGVAESGASIRLFLRTPYRATFATDGRLHYTLEAWVDGRKHLNFEWDTQGNYALRGFRKGGWVEDVAYWTFPSTASAAAEMAA